MILQILKTIQQSINKSVNEYCPQYVAFGIFGIFNYPIYHLIWLYASPQAFESLPLRLTATLLCLFLALNKYWPAKLQEFLPVYWYITLFFCFPFFFTYMLIKNHGANMWVTNIILIIFFLMFLVDWISCIILLFIGSILAICLVYITSNEIWFITDFDFMGFFITYFVSILIGAIFSHNKQMLEKHKNKMEVVASTGASIAHELRTPLRTISASAAGIKKYLPTLIETYQLARAANLPIPHIDAMHREVLKPAFDNIELEVESAFNFINMLLINANQTKINRDHKLCSIAYCVEQALSRYPFDLEERQLIRWQSEKDFMFMGNELLIIHVLFNLLKNSLYYIRAAGKGEISIWFEHREKTNLLYFKDTGKGISAKILPYIFERFFSKTQHGTGIGLAFCKLVMQNFGGDITCFSKEGEYTEFALSFVIHN